MGWVIILGIVVYFLLGQFFLGLVSEDDDEQVDSGMLFLIGVIWLPVAFIYVLTRILEGPYRLGQHLKSKYRRRKREKMKKNERHLR